MRDRTADLLRARQALSQLSYSPTSLWLVKLVGLSRFELPTSPLSGARSNQLSYSPIAFLTCFSTFYSSNLCGHLQKLTTLRKEVIQPQVPLGLPCYDLAPVMHHTVAIALQKVQLRTYGAAPSQGFNGGW